MRLVSSMMKNAGLALAVGMLLGSASTPALAAPSTTAAAECGNAMSVGSGARATLKSCTESGRIRVTGQLVKTAADGTCARLTIRIGRYQDNWRVCDGQREDIDTGQRIGTRAYVFLVRA